MWLLWRQSWFLGGKQIVGDKGARQCKHCGRNNHISEKCYEKFGRLKWAQLADDDTSAPGDTARVHSLSAPHSAFSGSLTVVLSQEKYDRLRQLEFSQNSHSVIHASSSGMNAYITSPQKSWILNSGASSQ